jgi:hypothetical protein
MSAQVDWTRIATIGIAAFATVYVVRLIGGAAKDAVVGSAGAVADAAANLPTSSSYTARTTRVLTSPVVAPLAALATLTVTLPGGVKALGRIIFPDKSSVAVNDVRLSSAGDGLPMFSYKGFNWKIVSRSGSDLLAQKA